LFSWSSRRNWRGLTTPEAKGPTLIIVDFNLVDLYLGNTLKYKDSGFSSPEASTHLSLTFENLWMITMVYCMECGKELSEDARYCSKCGASVKASEWEEFQVSADDLVGRVKELISEGNVSRLIVRNERGDTLLEIPVTVGVIGALFVPYLAALGAIAALATRCTIAVERRVQV
jgi:hypothetical protein